MPIQTGDTEVEVSKPYYLHNVNFSYETDKQVLHNVSFTARQGEITAPLLVSSGGGKSTAAKLAARFWDINSGKITLGGHDVSNIEPETLLKNYAAFSS